MNSGKQPPNGDRIACSLPGLLPRRNEPGVGPGTNRCGTAGCSCNSDTEPPAPAATLVAQALERTVRVRRLFDNLRQLLLPHGLSESQLALLWACQAPVAVSQVELAAQADLSPAHVSAQLEHLRRAGFLASSRDPHDRRRQQWHLTSQGRLLVCQLAQQLTPWAHSCLQASHAPAASHTAQEAA